MESEKTRMSVERERLRQQMLEKANEAFDRMFAEDEQEGLITFTQREERACQLGQEMARWMIEQHLASDPRGRASEEIPSLCPKCGKAGRRESQGQELFEERVVISRAGAVRLKRQKWRCASCRLVFFPLGPASAAGDGRV